MNRALPAAATALLLAACAGTPNKSSPPPQSSNASRAPSTHASSSSKPGARRSPYAPAQEDPSKRGDYVAGGLYAPGVKDSAPPDIDDVDQIPEPEVRDEPRALYGNRDYAVLGKKYHVLEDPSGYVETGMASFYGQKFHGRRTSSLEVYDMYAFSAAHKTLPLPSFARVTNLANGKSVIVRVNDRGPFHDGRIIDLSYAAAVKLGVNRAGTARVEVRALTTHDRGPDMRMAQEDAPPPALPAPSAPLPSAMDRMVAALPIATAEAGERKQAGEVEPSPPGPWRFDMRQDGKAMTADEFDAWMKSRQVHVATGKAGAAAVGAVVREIPKAVPTPVVADTGDADDDDAPSAPVSPPPVASSGGVVLQVASFAARANAERALAMLEGAGIRGARLLDGTAAGQKVWRLRVGPVASDRVAELSATVAGLGFGRPNIVRD
ncbi:septal ring lytic transglycosylase RlpA family protein [Lysobacter sp. KIS68-7]|uniref:septal ring lytic transglycosylase RlpA family protein n=1 Tax=Lysobacter sp. KIS68-7 TaxID=2904252 RepID=UPI001E432623|nr:septal ring lytic transglycosylase RlpA family protein [Lysobacter sp. KIS68-7]UHQ20254.1 septal ring lytic transglycosylase RlpA family protein [Lysobacter sp. KIS68-7]